MVNLEKSIENMNGKSIKLITLFVMVNMLMHIVDTIILKIPRTKIFVEYYISIYHVKLEGTIYSSMELYIYNFVLYHKNLYRKI